MPFRNPFARSESDLAQEQLNAIEKQGSGLVRSAHGLAFAMIVATSIASLITLAGTVVNRIVSTLASHRSATFTDTASILISLLFVVVMDLAAVIGATQIRVILERSLDRRWLRLHVPVVVVVSLIEGVTYGLMLWTYDPPVDPGHGALIIARAAAVPILSLYLVLSRVTPAGEGDIIALAGMASGMGLLRDVFTASRDTGVSMGRKAEILQATSGPGDPAAKLKALMVVLQTPDGIKAGTDVTTLVRYEDLDRRLSDLGTRLGEATRQAIDEAVETSSVKLLAEARQVIDSHALSLSARHDELANQFTERDAALDTIRAALADHAAIIEAKLSGIVSDLETKIARVPVQTKAPINGKPKPKKSSTVQTQDGSEEARARAAYISGMPIKRLASVAAISQASASKFKRIFDAERAQSVPEAVSVQTALAME